MRRVREESGFSLVEMLVAMTMALVVFGATVALLGTFQEDNRRDQLRNEAQDGARNAMDRLARELRDVIAPTTLSFGALEQAGPYSLTFQTIDPTQGPPGKNTLDAMRVRYCLDDENSNDEVLWKQVERWETPTAPALPTASACPDPSTTDWESSFQLAHYLTNKIGGRERALFKYDPPSPTIEPAQVVAVEPNLYINPTPSQQRPGETQLTSAISLRNANRQPIAAFTVTPVLGSEPKVILDASESHDPDGLTLTYKWWDGSTLLASTGQRFETGVLANGTHEFKLEVTNPGGLSNTATKTVEIT
jgi:prepilin-type N-terminal cleavage/methylation domain-containing protein